MRSFTFKGIRIREVTIHGNKRYEIDMSLAGERKRKYFKTLQEAKDEAARQAILQGHIGQKAFQLDESSREDALKAIELLKEYKTSLQDAAKFYIKHQSAKQGRGINELIDEYISYQKKRVNSTDETDSIREKSYTDIKQRIGFWRVFDERSPDSISDEEIRAVIKSKNLSGTSQKNYLRHLSIFFRWCIDHGYGSANPVEKIKIKQRRKDPKIYEPNEVISIFEKSKEIYPDIIPYFALAFFAGVRPDEIMRMSWEDIKWKRNVISISTSTSKTNSSRNILIKPNLKSWLKKYESTGKIFPHSESTLKRKRASIYKAAELSTIQDGARHSFATFYYALEGLEKTIDALGHSSSEMLLKHYKSQIVGREEEAKEFFDINCL